MASAEHQETQISRWLWAKKRCETPNMLISRTARSTKSKRAVRVVSFDVKEPRRIFGEVGMTVLVVRHLTKYRYKQPVRLGEHRLMFRPRDSFDQRLLHSHLAISPQPCRLRWIHDVFGNCVTLFDFDTSSTYIDVESIIRLEHTPENAPDFQIEEYAKLHPFEYAAEQMPDLSSSMRRQCVDPDDNVKRWLRGFLNIGRKQPTGRLLMTLNEAIADGFSYVRRTAPGTQSPVETLKSRSGSCRDFALLMMEAARSMGFAAPRLRVLRLRVPF
jgi:transglutaminase-like putative cysteine protease